jgi:hypothetical protein
MFDGVDLYKPKGVIMNVVHLNTQQLKLIP